MESHVLALMLDVGTERFKFSKKVIQNLDYLHTFKDIELRMRIANQSRKEIHLPLVFVTRQVIKNRVVIRWICMTSSCQVSSHIADSLELIDYEWCYR